MDCTRCGAHSIGTGHDSATCPQCGWLQWPGITYRGLMDDGHMPLLGDLDVLAIQGHEQESGIADIEVRA